MPMRVDPISDELFDPNRLADSLSAGVAPVGTPHSDRRVQRFSGDRSPTQESVGMPFWLAQPGP
jgi:hypothetical protein